MKYSDLIFESDTTYIICVNDDPVMTFNDPMEAKRQLDHLKNRGLDVELKKQVCTAQVVAESTDPSTVLDMIKKLLPIAVKELELQSLPKMKPVTNLTTSDHPSFGKFVNETNTIEFAVNNRHPIDILRTLSHELVHCKQREDQRLKPNSGATGSNEENEANARAGVIMRNFDDAYPGYFKETPVTMNEAGIAGIGRQAVNYVRNIGSDPHAAATLYTNPKNMGSYVISGAISKYPVTNVPLSSLTPWEPDSKTAQPGNRAHVMQMAMSIEQGKQLPPITVVKKGGSYLIIDGHHRYAAYKAAGAEQVPVRIVDKKDVRYTDEIMESLSTPRRFPFLDGNVVLGNHALNDRMLQYGISNDNIVSALSRLTAKYGKRLRNTKPGIEIVINARKEDFSFVLGKYQNRETIDYLIKTVRDRAGTLMHGSHQQVITV
jgi:hypothetical protein